MTQILWLNENEPEFPATQLALSDPDGLLAAGGRLDVNWLTQAYSKGIFPWFNEGDPLLWWSPAPRMVLYPDQLRLNKTLKKHIRRTQDTQITFNQDFESVIFHCATRTNGEDTWITEDMIQAYVDAHDQGLAHSVELWQEGKLVGGMYGIAMGGVFFGESMFSKIQSASRFCLAALVRYQPNLTMVDCQLESAHVAALGAQLVNRHEFEQHLKENITDPKVHLFNWDQHINLENLLDD